MTRQISLQPRIFGRIAPPSQTSLPAVMSSKAKISHAVENRAREFLPLCRIVWTMKRYELLKTECYNNKGSPRSAGEPASAYDN